MDAGRQSKSNHYAALGLSALLLYGLADAVLVRAGEYPMPPAHYLDMGIDAALTLVLGGLLVALARAPSGPLLVVAQLAGGAGVLAGIAQLGIRLSSDHGWWTGHLYR